MDYKEITRTLFFCIAIPVPLFTLAICYLVFAYNYIYNEEELPTQVKTLCLLYRARYQLFLVRKPSVVKKVEREDSLSPEEEAARVRKKKIQAALQRQLEDRKQFREKYMILKKISIQY